jgi:excisionase family DNA binding protein
VEGRADGSTAKSRDTHRRTFGNREGGVKARGGEVIDLLTIEEVAERLRVSVLTVRWLRQEGRFAPAIKVGRRLSMGCSRRGGPAGISARVGGGGLMGVQRKEPQAWLFAAPGGGPLREANCKRSVG